MIVTVGESVFDIIFKEGKPISSVFGGSMYNVAVSIGRAGAEVAFAGFRSNDRIGEGAALFLRENNVDTKYFNKIENSKSNIAIAFLNDHGIPEYTFYRDELLMGHSLKLDLDNIELLLVGSFFAINDKNYNFIYELIINARSRNIPIMYDPNIRNREIFKDVVMRNRVDSLMKFSDFVKMSDEDITSVTGERNENSWVEYLNELNVQYFLITRGDMPAMASYKEDFRKIEIPEVNVLSTVGAGDATSAGILSCGIDFLKTGKNFFIAIEKGIKFGSHVCTLNENFIEKDFKNQLDG